MQTQSAYHIFNLPRELLDTLTLRTLLSEPPPPSAVFGNDGAAPIPPSAAADDGKPPLENADATSASGANTYVRTCNICLGTTFLDVDEQRTHFRSDWHRYNVKVRLNGGQPVLEEKFAQLVEALEDSLSGSASSSEDESSGEGSSDAVTTLINRTKRLNSHLNTTSDDQPNKRQQLPQTPFAWFHSSQHQTQLGVYKAVFPAYITEPESHLDELKEMQKGGEEGRTWAMFMVAGGHFAGAIVKVGKSDREKAEEEEEAAMPATGRKKKPKKPKPVTEVLRHKTFHRYTTRRKQGGSQSLNDNAKGPAKSAGALLRRYGEQALQDDIRNLLIDWAEDIDACERIWIRASISNRRIFLDFDGPISKGDYRLRTFPFPTRRPTQSELLRCLLELTRPKVSHLTEEELRAQDEAYIASTKPKPPKPAPVSAPQPPSQPAAPPKPKLTKEEEQFKEKWLRVLDMINRDRLEALRSFWEREGDALGGINALMPEYVNTDVSGPLKRAGTLLQAATSVGSENVVGWLLEERDADPTIPIPSSTQEDEREIGEGGEEEDEGARVPLKPGARRTAYDLARNKAVRDVFRRCAATSPDKWDWLGAARVPSLLSKEMEEEREEKKKTRRKGLKERVKEREKEAASKEATDSTAEDVPPPEPVVHPKRENLTGPRKLGGSAGASDAVAGLTPEMRAKVERERRARAAEARLKALSGNKS